jgi:hypothetical protein
MSGDVVDEKMEWRGEERRGEEGSGVGDEVNEDVNWGRLEWNAARGWGSFRVRSIFSHFPDANFGVEWTCNTRQLWQSAHCHAQFHFAL